MKKSTVMLLLFATIVWQLQAQDSIFVYTPPAKDYITTITSVDPGKLSQPVTIIEVRDSSLLLSPLVTGKNFFPGTLPLSEVYAFEIESIKIHRPNRFIRGALNGALVGFVVGAIAGLADGSDPEGTWFAMTAGEKALMGGVLLGATGGVVGGIVGPMLSVRIPIKGSVDTFARKKANLARYQLVTRK